MKKVRGQKGVPYLRLIADEINLFVNTHVRTTLRDCVPSPERDGLLRGGSSLTRGDVIRVIGEIEDPTSLHNFGVSVAYLLPTEFLRFVCELRYDVVALGLGVCEVREQGRDGTNRSCFTYDVPNPFVVTEKGANELTPRESTFVYTSTDNVIR